MAAKRENGRTMAADEHNGHEHTGKGRCKGEKAVLPLPVGTADGNGPWWFGLWYIYRAVLLRKGGFGIYNKGNEHEKQQWGFRYSRYGGTAQTFRTSGSGKSGDCDSEKKGDGIEN